MKIYLVILEDRHVDVKVTPFCDRDAAKKYAFSKLNEYPDHTIDSYNGWDLCATLNGEGDYIRVEGVELIGADND